MFGMITILVRSNGNSLGRPLNVVRALASVRVFATNLVQRVAAPITKTVARLVRQERTTTPPDPTVVTSQRDRLRQALNLLLSVAQFAAAAIIFSSQFGDELFYNPANPNPPIVPADYAFSIWGFIFPTSIAYGVYQALPRQRTNALLRRIGWQTAFAFGCITLWSVATLFDPLRYTVPLFFGALGALVYALYQTSRHPQLTLAEQAFVLVPVSVYAAWCTVGTIANTSTSLAGLGYTRLLLGEQTWAVVMLVVAGLISSFTTTAGRGNIPYALAIIWALVGVVVTNVTRYQNPVVAATAGGMAALLAIVLVWARTAVRAHTSTMESMEQQ